MHYYPAEAVQRSPGHAQTQPCRCPAQMHHHEQDQVSEVATISKNPRSGGRASRRPQRCVNGIFHFAGLRFFSARLRRGQMQMQSTSRRETASE
jgi:hypothetical protein